MEPNRITDRTKAFIDHILTKSAEKLNQSGVTGMRLYDHQLIYCSRKVSLLRSNEYYKVSNFSKNNYSNELFVDTLRSIKLSNHSNHTCVLNVCQDFVTKFSSAIDYISLIRTLRVKPNTKFWFNNDALYVAQNHDRFYEKLTQSSKVLDKIKFKYANFSIKNTINNNEKLSLKKSCRK